MKDFCCIAKLELLHYNYQICNIACINGHLKCLKNAYENYCVLNENESVWDEKHAH